MSLSALGDDTASDASAGVTGVERLLIRCRRVTRRDVAEVVRTGMDHDGCSTVCDQFVDGECIGRGDQRGGAVFEDLNRSEVAARRVARVTLGLEVSACREEVTRLSAARSYGIGLALGNLVNVESVESGVRPLASRVTLTSLPSCANVTVPTLAPSVPFSVAVTVSAEAPA